jgi:GT2 family glycosyltransferase
MTDRTVDILMITWRRPAYTRLSLERLLETCDEDMRVWIWHNGDHAETLAIAREHAEHPRVHRFHHSRENRKLWAPTNWLLGESDGAYLSKVDDDCLLTDGWASALRAAHEAEPRFGVLGCWRFQDEDFDPALAAPKIRAYGGGHRVLENCWVEGSGYLMKRACVESAGALRDGESFSQYCIRVASYGWINGWAYPFVRQEHMDLPLSAIHRGLRSIDAWTEQLRRSARIVQEAPTDPRVYRGVRKKLRRLRARLRGEELVY